MKLCHDVRSRNWQPSSAEDKNMYVLAGFLNAMFDTIHNLFHRLLNYFQAVLSRSYVVGPILMVDRDFYEAVLDPCARLDRGMLNFRAS
jgi:hypothetical protein